jgi:hypothetical protein
LNSKIKFLGNIALGLGSIATLLCVASFFFAFPLGLLLSLPVGFIGMICSCIYVFKDTQNQINTKKITAGVIGVFLNSIPILVILTLMIVSRFKN